MVLFKKDIYDTRCYIDTRTKNKSFIKMSVLLDAMGISNNKFMLALMQEELKGVDPHSKNLTKEQKLKIALECKINPWYFFREVIRVPAQGGDPVYYQLNRANLALIWCFLNNVDTFVTMPRQIGKTVGVLSITDMLLYVTGQNTNMAMFAKDGDLRTENVRRVKELREGLPSWMFQEGSAFNTNNQETIEYKPLNNKYLTFVAQSDKKRAAKQGRGESFIWSHWDEFAYYINNKLSYPSAIAATDTVKELARANGIPCATIITTTAGYTSSEEGKYAYSFTSGALRFSEKIYDVESYEKLKELVDNSSTNGFCYLEYNYRQLGKDEAWFKDRTRNKPPEVIATDYLNKWIHGTGESIIPKRLIDLLEENIEEPISITIDEGIVMRWFADQSSLDTLFKNVPFIIGSDTSDNIGRDFTTIVMLNPKDMAIVMTCRCNQTNMVFVANIIFNLMTRFPRSIFVPERNRAATLLDILIHMITSKTKWNVFNRIFNYYYQESGDAISYKKLDINLGSVRKSFGFKTTGAENSRKFLYSKVLSTVIERNYSRIFDKVIIDEILGLVVRDGRIDHDTSGNDDTLIAYLIASWLILYGKNIYMYGIDPSEILSSSDDDKIDGVDIGITEIYNRIKELEEKIESGRVSDLMLNAYRIELQELKTLLPDDINDTKNLVSVNQVDKLIEEEDSKFDMVQTGIKIQSIF